MRLPQPERERSRDPGISFACSQSLFLSCHYHYLFLPLPSSSYLTLNTVRFACNSPSYLPPLRNALPSTPAVLRNLISSDVFQSKKALLSISIKFRPFRRTHNAIVPYKIQAQFKPYRLQMTDKHSTTRHSPSCDSSFAAVHRHK